MTSGNDRVDVANFIKKFALDSLNLCGGIRTPFEEINGYQFWAGNSKFQILADFVDEKVVFRDRKCKFALVPEEGEVKRTFGGKFEIPSFFKTN